MSISPISSRLSEVFAGLEPSAVWQHFATLCAIPRASKQEAQLRDYLQCWAVERGLAANVDPAGNLIICKPGAPGRETAPGVVLQAHLDMVCQKNADSPHDFKSDSIIPALRDGWLIAEGTTLGADNGIGVALVLAVLEDASLMHGPLEALLTVDEEAGMGGAHGLAPEALRGRLMLNLDTEDWGEFYLGCAGGLDVNVEHTGMPAPLPVGWSVFSIELRGLRGGHSGVNIHEERGNAIKLLVRVLRRLEKVLGLRLASLTGGTARNALPREATAVVAVAPEHAAEIAPLLASAQAELRAELAGVDEGLSCALNPGVADFVLSEADQERWLAALNASPYGVYRMSRSAPGVVETSNNLGVLDLQPANGSCNFMVRSLRDSGALALGEEITSLFVLAGCRVETTGHYPGWTPNPDSALLQTCQQVFKREFGGESTVKIIHAGLECGIIGAKHPGMDTVSFGPNIRGAHAPGERVEIASVGNCWKLLTAVLAEIR